MILLKTGGVKVLSLVSCKSPLRFPGSKSKVLKKLDLYLSIPHKEYREPFFGGGSIFFGKRLAEYNWVNDKDPYIYDFFITVRDNPIELCILIQQYGKPTIERWHQYRNEPMPDDRLERAYRFLFFNRTNYSGIFHSNPIGGLNQESQWKIDCRWNEKLICKRIIECSSKLQEVNITCFDFEEVISKPGENVLLMIDPPYYKNGSKLYPLSLDHNDHVRLSKLLKSTNHKFILTIDDCEEIREIYNDSGFYFYNTTWKYTINSRKQNNNGKELFISNFKVGNTNVYKDYLILDK